MANARKRNKKVSFAYFVVMVQVGQSLGIPIGCFCDNAAKKTSVCYQLELPFFSGAFGYITSDRA